MVEKFYVPALLTEYGFDKQDLLLQLTGTIDKIYKHLRYSTFDNVIIYVPFSQRSWLSNIAGLNPLSIASYDNLSPLTGSEITIEIKRNGELQYVINSVLDVSAHRNDAIIYHYVRATQIETIYGLTIDNTLPAIPDSDSYFAIQTYKDLDLALEDYSTKVARYSECKYLKDVWADDNKLFFKPKPEHILRDSLTYFLKIRLRNTEVRPEQIVDKSHPVDIKVTWTLASHLALIEIKWLGKALQTTGKKKFKKIYTRTRMLEGAKQLSEYLDSNLVQSPVKTTKGYLAVFDARRWGCSSSTTTVKKADGLKYLNEIIILTPDYSATRTDFAKPFRFFMEPLNMTN